ATDPGVHGDIATFELTNAVEPGQLDKFAALKMIGGSNVFAPNDPAPHFSVVYGLHNRQAYLRSSPIVLPASEDWMRVTINKQLTTVQGGAEMQEAVEKKTLVPSKETAFKINSISGSIVRNKEGEPEQILNIETSGDISTADLAKALHIYLLPKRDLKKTEPAKEEEEESNAETTPEETASKYTATEEDNNSYEEDTARHGY